jgi:hypothetical protein
MCAPTEFTTAVFNGDVFSRSKNAATAMAGIMAGPLANSATIMIGMPSSMLAAETR